MTIPTAPAMPSPTTPAPAAVAPRHNLFSLIAFIGAFFAPVVGIVFGHIALAQINRTAESGRGFALAGLWIGYAVTALSILAVLAYIAFVFWIMGTAASFAPQYSYHAG